MQRYPKRQKLVAPVPQRPAAAAAVRAAAARAKARLAAFEQYGDALVEHGAACDDARLAKRDERAAAAQVTAGSEPLRGLSAQKRARSANGLHKPVGLSCL